MIKDSIFKLQPLFFAILVAGAMASCNKDNGPQEPDFTKEELAEMAAVDRFAAANSVYRALGLLNELPDNWESKTYVPQVGVPVDEATTDVRNVISTGADHARSYFLSIVPDLGQIGDSWSHEGVGSLTYREVNEANCYAIIDVNLDQMPGLKQLRFVPKEVIGENSFTGKPYYHMGDVVKDDKGNWWICVRPAGGPLAKDYAYFVSLDSNLIKTTEQKQDIYEVTGTGDEAKKGKNKITTNTGKWVYAKNLVEERIAIAAAHTFSVLFAGQQLIWGHADWVDHVSQEMHNSYTAAFHKANALSDRIPLHQLVKTFIPDNDAKYDNPNSFAIAYGSYQKNQFSKLRQEKYIQPFLTLTCEDITEDGQKRIESIVKTLYDPNEGSDVPTAMPLSLTTDYDPLSYSYFMGTPAPEVGYNELFNVMNYVYDTGSKVKSEYRHMNGYQDDHVLLMTQTSVKDNGKPYSKFTMIINYELWAELYQPDYWKSLDMTERRVFDENGYYLPVEDIYE